MRLIDAEQLIHKCEERIENKWNSFVAPTSWVHAEKRFCSRVEDAPTVEAVLLPDLLDFRDWLYEHDAITMEGLAQLNQLIAKHKKEDDHE